MALTRATVEAALIARCGKALTSIGLDGTTVDGTNAALADPIGEGLRSLGLATATLGAVVSADVAQVVDADDYAQLLDVAELRALETVLANWTEPDQIDGQDTRQDLGKLRDGLEKTVSRKAAQAQTRYGYGAATGIETGVITFGFQSRDEATS